MRLALAVRLAIADLWHEPVLALCSILAVAAVLAPLLVLAGLRAGVVAGLREAILQDPHAREITTAANRSFDPALLDRIAARPDVAFLAPRTRTLSASLLLERDGELGTGVRVELIPSAPGDPLLTEAPGSPGAIVLSAAAASRLHASVGEVLTGRLARVLNARRDAISLPLRVQSVAPPGAFSREAAFVALPLALYVEDFQDGRAGPVTDLTVLPVTPRVEYAGFRLYARQLEQVPALDASLRSDGIDVVSRAGDVAGLLRVDRNLTLLFALVAGLGGAGFLVSLGAGLWANVERKRTQLALLRFMGLPASALRAVPMTQAAALACGGASVALAAAGAAALVVNRAFAGTLALDRPLCVISPGLVVVAVVVTVLGAVLVAALAGSRAARVEPWEGVSGV